MMISGYECLTVGELIAHLQTMPADAPVVYQCCSNWAAMKLEDVTFHPKNPFVPRISLSFVTRHPMAKWGDVIMAVDEQNIRWWGDETPNYIDVVAFPGN